jgi:hypothetical protein|tara:strand:+ start:168 stop:347 length:180 start_codon:yes stop_codon:yes gene_type:complete
MEGRDNSGIEIGRLNMKRRYQKLIKLMIKQSLSELKRGDSYKEIFERHLNDLRRCFEIK